MVFAAHPDEKKLKFINPQQCQEPIDNRFGESTFRVTVTCKINLDVAWCRVF
jgi:hypothetical protein